VRGGLLEGRLSFESHFRDSAMKVRSAILLRNASNKAYTTYIRTSPPSCKRGDGLLRDWRPIVRKNGRNYSNCLDIPPQLTKRLRRSSDRFRLESESYLMIGSCDLEQRIRFESACRSLTSADTFFILTSRA
jgi:hypothetical protein